MIIDALELFLSIYKPHKTDMINKFPGVVVWNPTFSYAVTLKSANCRSRMPRGFTLIELEEGVTKWRVGQHCRAVTKLRSVSRRRPDERETKLIQHGYKFESEVHRDIFKRHVKGESNRSIARDHLAKGIKPSTSQGVGKFLSRIYRWVDNRK